jgi:hypothetical protein
MMVSQKNQRAVDGARGRGGRSAALCARWQVVTEPSWHGTHAGRDMWPLAIVGLWQADPFNLIFSLNFEINIKFEIHNEGLSDV